MPPLPFLFVAEVPPSSSSYTIAHFAIAHFAIAHFTIAHFTITHFAIAHFTTTVWHSFSADEIIQGVLYIQNDLR